jgi:RNA polymerase sigma factor (sigma-70 family)
VHNPSQCQSFFRLVVAESSRLREYGANPEQSEWTEEEIAAIRLVLHKLTSIRILNPNDAEDLVQETLLTMLVKHPGNTLEKGLLVWTMGILRKKVGNYYRRANRFTCLNAKEQCRQPSLREFAASSSPESSFFHEELQRILARTMAELPSPQRQAIELLIAGHDSGEIVQQLHPARYQNVINHIHRGRKKLAQELAKYGYGPAAKSGLRKMKMCKPRK